MLTESIAKEFVSIAGFHLLAVASPGPDFAIVLKQSLRYGKRIGIYTALGIGSGILLHIIYSLLGFGLLIQKFEWAYIMFKLIGAGYLIYLGIMALKAQPFEVKNYHHENTGIPHSKAFKQGFFVNALNVKATLFFITIYTAFVSQQTPIGWQVSYGLYMAIATALWFSFLAILFGNKHIKSKIGTIGIWIERITGVVMIVLAFKLLFF